MRMLRCMLALCSNVSFASANAAFGLAFDCLVVDAFQYI